MCGPHSGCPSLRGEQYHAAVSLCALTAIRAVLSEQTFHMQIPPELTKLGSNIYPPLLNTNIIDTRAVVRGTSCKNEDNLRERAGLFATASSTSCGKGPCDLVSKHVMLHVSRRALNGEGDAGTERAARRTAALQLHSKHACVCQQH